MLGFQPGVHVIGRVIVRPCLVQRKAERVENVTRTGHSVNVIGFNSVA